jgi:hypothetical protein
MYFSPAGTKSPSELHTYTKALLTWVCKNKKSNRGIGGSMVMACASCGSEKQTQFGTEMMIHFPGLEALDKPGVLAFPKVTVCFSCGLTGFVLPERELHLLKKDSDGVSFKVA